MDRPFSSAGLADLGAGTGAGVIAALPADACGLKETARVMIPGPQVHAMKLAFEKYYLWKSRHGYVRLP
jgi:hypothetical protein